MNKILNYQKLLLEKIAENYGAENNPSAVTLNCGQTVQYIRDMQTYLNEEITEVILAISNDDRSILKPWSTKYNTLAEIIYAPTNRTKSEAIDMLCFCLNICLAAGLTPENIEKEYINIFKNNIHRQNNNY